MKGGKAEDDETPYSPTHLDGWLSGCYLAPESFQWLSHGDAFPSLLIYSAICRLESDIHYVLMLSTRKKNRLVR